MGFPAGGQGIAFGAFCPSGSAFLVEALAAQRIRDLDILSGDPELSPETRGLISRRQFHTYADFCLELKSKRPGKNDVIGYGDSLRRGEADLTGYLAYLRERDPQFAAFLEKPQGAVIDREFFDTSVYITGETKSGKSYLAETLAFLLAREPQAGVWVLDPHGALARSCATWHENRGRPALYFDVNLTRGRFPRFNPFDQLPDREAATLDTVTQEQVNAFAVIAGASAMTDNMRRIVLGFVLYLKSRRIKKPRYAIQSTNLVKNYVSRLDGVEITYHQRKISNLTVTRIAIWNDGNETIDRNDVASSDPITIRIKNDYKISHRSYILRIKQMALSSCQKKMD